MKNEFIQSLPKEKLIQFIEDYFKNLLTMDGGMIRIIITDFY